MATTVISADGRFEWDIEKDDINFKKHGFHFAEILEVFDDPYFMEKYDVLHSNGEERYIGSGCLCGIVIIVTTYTDRNGRIRIINARKGDKNDKEAYDDYVKKFIY